MVSNSKQNWMAGSTVKVGFLSLVVVAPIATPGDHAPDAYILKNAAGTKVYRFVPHNGVEAISPVEARELIAQAEAAAARAAARAVQKAKQDADAAALINALVVA